MAVRMIETLVGGDAEEGREERGGEEGVIQESKKH